MTHKVKWGILGCANIVRRRFMPGMRKARNAEVAAIASRDLAKAEAFASELGIPRAYGSYEDLLDDPEVEAVYVPLPNWLHAEWTICASAKGKHVLCEKPLAVDEKECREVVNACRANGTLLMEGFMYRFHPRALKAKAIADSGRLGEVRVIHSWSSHVLGDSNNIRLDPRAGALADVGCYCVDASRYFLGAATTVVCGQWRLHPEREVDTSFAGMLEFPGGRVALFDCGFEYSYRQGYQLIGTEGTLFAERGFVPGDAARSLRLTTQTGDVESVRVRGADQFALEIDHFSDCVRSGKPVMLDPTEATENARVMDALRLSARNGERVSL
ncbi:MAG: Gfo/Idh/MocA family oxidoreductase [Armatimonadota bacterium]|nr:Gfo/Idh/MocA family oxidoreductase [Armatimonadota bacterium]